jgi:phosphoribosyl-ATP pyrophosphohydrolase
LQATIQRRQTADAGSSYTARLLQGAEDAVLKKVVEEAGEVVLAAKGGDPSRIAEEMADLWYHCLVMMTRYNVSLSDVFGVLSARQGTSGLAEKASRHDG